MIVSFYGLSKIKSVSFLVDDVPAESSLMKDLKFFESNFSGVMPLEIVVDTKMKKGIQNLNLLKRVDRLEQFLEQKDYVSSPVSLALLLKHQDKLIIIIILHSIPFQIIEIKILFSDIFQTVMKIMYLMIIYLNHLWIR